MFNIWINSVVKTPSQLPLGQYYDTLISVKAPLITALIYLLVVSAWSKAIHNSKASTKNPSSGIILKTFVVFHNLILMIFSLLTFYHAAAVTYNQTISLDSKLDQFCDSKQTAWKNGFFYWGWLFYLSKYYEMIDTLIILIKGRTPLFLQSYHHAGAIISMWALVANQCPSTWIFVTLNSFIHTIMYTYYIITTLGYSLPGKRYITYMQIIQFITGISLALIYIYLPQCQTSAQNASLIFFISYVTPLIYLFSMFAKASYSNHPKLKSK